MNQKHKSISPVVLIVILLLIVLIFISKSSLEHAADMTLDPADKLTEETPGPTISASPASVDPHWQAFMDWTSEFFLGRNRSTSYHTEGNCYLPVLTVDSSTSEEKEWFCSAVTAWINQSLAEFPYQKYPEFYEAVYISYMGKEYRYDLGAAELPDGTADAGFYNDLYDFVEDIIVTEYEAGLHSPSSDSAGNASSDLVPAEEMSGSDSETGASAFDAETIALWLSYTPDCSFTAANGTEYLMLPVDRAAGSSYYVMIATSDGRKSADFINPDPYLGSGGGAKWLSFLDDQLGFSCLTYSGGAYGLLFRTEDGGKSFMPVEYPSSKALLPDGTYYNPFVMPERVYEENGVLYMIAGQGPDGDYYNAEGHCSGLYQSEDKGMSWKFVGEVVE